MYKPDQQTLSLSLSFSFSFPSLSHLKPFSLTHLYPSYSILSYTIFPPYAVPLQSNISLLCGTVKLGKWTKKILFFIDNQKNDKTPKPLNNNSENNEKNIDRMKLVFFYWIRPRFFYAQNVYSKI